MIEIDCSSGEGGGQMVRSSLALAMLTGESVLLDNIRARRKNPGLQRQHLTAVMAAAEMSGAGMTGATLHSSRLTFAPGPVRSGTYRFDIGTAGSASLVLQTVLLPLLLAEGHSELSIIGGTHNPLAPPFEFFAETYLPQLKKMGLHASVKLVKRGFYPAGGGELRVAVSPATELLDYKLLERGKELRYRGTVIVAKLPLHIAERESAVVLRKLNWKPTALMVVDDVGSRGPGNAILLHLQFERITEVVASIGARGKRSEQVAEEAVEEAKCYLTSSAPVGPHLADQLLLPLGIAASRGHRGTFRTFPLTQHSQTHIEILKRFLSIAIEIEAQEDGSVIVTVAA